MKNKQLVYLFFCNFAVFFIGGALLPLLPLYATELGASSTLTGLYLGIIYLAIAAGTMLAGWLAESLPPKSLFVGAGSLGVPMLVLHGQVTTFWQLILLTSTVWFCAGIGTALVSVFISLHADNQHRGKSFSLMFLARPLGSVLGGLTAGQLVAWQGYPLLFVVLGAVWAGWPVVALIAVEYKSAARPIRSVEIIKEVRPAQPGLAFHLLLLAAFLSTTVVYFGRLGTSLSMQLLNFSPQVVANTAAAGALVTIPITPVIGTLSDRLGRKIVLILCYLLAAAGVLTLSLATESWHFGLATVFLLVTNSANGSAAAALATDLLDRKTLSRSLPWLNGVTWFGGVAGFAGAGYIIDNLGAATLYYVAVGLSLLAAIQIGLLAGRRWASWVQLSSLRITKVAPTPKKA